MKHELYGFHILLTTHNSRTSQRMITYEVIKGPPRILSLKEEIVLTQIIRDIIIQNEYRCIAYSICKDQVQFILLCNINSINHIIQKIKSVSSKLFQRNPSVNLLTTRAHSNRLWSQKFYKAQIKLEPHFRYTFCWKLLVSLTHERHRKGLEYSAELCHLIYEFIIPYKEAIDPNFTFKGS